MFSMSPPDRGPDTPADPRRRLLLELGSALLSGGLPVHDVEEELRALGRALGAPDVRVAAFTTGLFVSLGKGISPVYPG